MISDRREIFGQWAPCTRAVELLNGKLELAIARTADGEDYKLVARKIPRIAPKPRLMKPANDPEKAQYLADWVCGEIRRQPKGGRPKEGFIVFLCTLYPESLIRDALGLAKADY